MISRVLYSTILLVFCFNGLVAKALTLDETAFEILTKSPQYKSQDYALTSTINTLKTESNLPDPEASGEYLVMPQDVDNRWTAQLEWGVEWPGVYGARGKAAKAKMSVAEKQLAAERAEKLAEIKDLLLDYIRSYQKLLLLEELSQNNDTIYRLAQEAARGGEMTVLDLNKVRLEYANIRVAKATLLDEQADVIANISQIYGKDCVDLLFTMDKTFPDIYLPSEEEIARIKENAPAVQAALSEIKTAEMGKKVAKMEALPNLSLGYKHSFEDGMHFNGAVFGVSIPIFSSRGKQKAAKAEILDAEVKAEATALEIETEAMATLKRLELVLQQINEIAPIIENADYNSTLLKAYKNGVLTLIEYISDRNYFTTAAIELVSLRHNAAKALAFLQRYL
ncbi:MAG: TolC family protein [Muribaculaceae bacterium]|nr:TolC family protein [Muribaculaceae bacterium]